MTDKHSRILSNRVHHFLFHVQLVFQVDKKLYEEEKILSKKEKVNSYIKEQQKEQVFKIIIKIKLLNKQKKHKERLFGT
jgi:hypothetical protein